MSPSLSAQPLSDYRDGLVLPLSAEEFFYPEFQDELGYLWGKDEQGRVVRYDGYALESFQAAPFDTVGLQCNGRSFLTEDTHGNIWIATGSCGLDRYDPGTGKVDRLHHAFHQVRKVPAQYYWGIYEDSRQDIWIRAQRQLFKYTPATQEFTKVSGMWHLTAVLEDYEGNIWALDPFLKKSFYKVGSLPEDTVEVVDFPLVGKPHEIARFPIVPILATSDHKIHFIAFGGRLYRFDIPARKAELLTKGLREGERVHTVYNDGITLVGTDQQRLLEYNDRTGRFRPFLDLPAAPGKEGVVKKIFRSRDGILWVVTASATYRVLPRELPFRKLDAPDNLRPPTYAGLSEFVVSFGGTVYWLTKSGLQPVLPEQGVGPIPLELEDTDFRFPARRSNESTPSVEAVKSSTGFKFLEARDGNGLWALLYQYPFGTKVFRYNRLGEREYAYACSGYDNCFTDHVLDIDLAHDGRIWLAGWAGVSCFDPVSQTFKNLWVKDGLPERTCVAILCSRDGDIWIGFNSAGLARYDPEEDCFDYYQHDEEVRGSLSSNYSVVDLLEDREGNIWVATNNGLNRYDPERNTFELFHREQGLLSPQVSVLKEGQHGRIWVGTQRSLSCYNREKGEFLNYGEANGVASKAEFHPHALHDREGRLFFQVDGGVIYFHPDSVAGAKAPKLCLRDLQLANVPVKPGDTTGVLSKPIGFTESLTLQPHQNVFTISYAALEYLAPEDIKYAFQLEGFDKDWRMVGNLREATYTNLTPGDYRFKVKCWNRHGLEGEPIFLNITILPPWYRTTWAYLLWTMLALALLYVAYRLQLNRERLRAQLAYEQREAERLAALDRMKSNFFSNITHEFRTPLSIILGMVSQINRDPQGWLGEGLSKIRQYSFQLLRLVNQMLDLSRLESDKLPVSKLQGDIIPFLKYLVESFGSYAQSKEVGLQLEVVPEQLVMDYEAEKITAIVSNLLSNAVKFTPAGGQVKVKIQEADGHLQLEVADTGQGMAKGQLPYIFDRFYQVDGSMTRAKEGTGIGLALTKELVKLLSGRIEVESELGVGTTFTVLLPITQQAPAAGQSVPAAAPEWRVPRAHQPDVPAEAAGTEGKDEPLLLIVEDNRDVIDYLATFLGPAYRVKRAENGVQGIEKARALVPDLIISDVMMPEKDGFELCDTLKNDKVTSHIPIILLTAKSGIGARIAGRKRGADAYLSKPFSEQELLVVIENLLEQRQRLQEHFREGRPPTEDMPEDIRIEDAFLQQLREIVEAHIDQKIEMPWLAQQVHLSRSQLYRKTKALIGKTPTDFITDIRIARSKQLLRETDQLVSEIGYTVGYDDPAYFSRLFRENVGMPPSEWRDKGGDAT